MLANISCIADTFVSQGDKGRALELFAFLLHHPENYNTIRGKAEYRCAQLQAELDTEVYQAAWKRGKALKLETVILELLHEAETEHP
jgi:hypothetical protein